MVITHTAWHAGRAGLRQAACAANDACSDQPYEPTKTLLCAPTESPTNPYLRCVDIPRIAALCHAAGALVVIDSTFATPINQRALSLGADLVIHSATKYLAGHNDVMAGARARARTSPLGTPPCPGMLWGTTPRACQVAGRSCTLQCGFAGVQHATPKAALCIGEDTTIGNREGWVACAVLQRGAPLPGGSTPRVV